MTAVRALVLTGYGLNCDNETAYALALSGAAAERVHINALIDGSVSLADFQMLVFGGGFSWGDDHGAGVVQAIRMKTNIGSQLQDFVAGGNLVIGICNGFQTLVNIGLLPGLDGDYQARSVALVNNDCGNFRDQWVRLAVNADSPCVFTRGIAGLELPVRHGEGKFYAATDVVERLLTGNQVALRYARPDGSPAEGAFPDNPNGSIHDIAGVCDPTGRVFGLMPHPEAFNHWTNHPDAFRIGRAVAGGAKNDDRPSTPGLQMFSNAVSYLQQK